MAAGSVDHAGRLPASGWDGRELPLPVAQRVRRVALVAWMVPGSSSGDSGTHVLDRFRCGGG